MKKFYFAYLVTLMTLSSHAYAAFDAQKLTGSYDFISCQFDSEFYKYNTAPPITGAEVTFSDNTILFEATGAPDYSYKFSHVNEGEIVWKYKTEGNCYIDTVNTKGSENNLSIEQTSRSHFSCIPIFVQKSESHTSLQQIGNGTVELKYKATGGVLWNHTCLYKKKSL